MASILDKYGIKEVADVTFYEINEDGTPGAPVLYLDTLKVSTVDQSADQAEARGGKGNPPLIIWDYGKEINVTLEDALFSAKSLAVMFGNGSIKDTITENDRIMKTFTVIGDETPIVTLPDGSTITPSGDGVKFYNVNGQEVTTRTAGVTYYCTVNLLPSARKEIEISSATFPGTYYVTGDTYARSQTTGKDEFFQFIIQKAKVTSENTITLEAEGDPSVFNLNLRVLRPADGKMMKLVQYSLSADATGVITGANVVEGVTKTITIAKGGTATLGITTANTTGTITVTSSSSDNVTATLSQNKDSVTLSVDGSATVGEYTITLKNGDSGTTTLDTITVSVVAS